jgi:16S rRNA (cytosine1402-N4)-methyltransferase
MGMIHNDSTSEPKENPDDVYHIPVLLNETIEGLAIKPNGIYVDCTFGGGGHSRAILERLGENGKLFVFDQDEDARKNLPDDKRVFFIHQNFRHIKSFLRLQQVEQVDGILADLGVSSHQFDEGSRGFSIRFDAPLDMRMDVRQGKTAADVLNKSSEHELHKIFERYGEVSNAKTLARVIVEKRQTVPIVTISGFQSMIKDVVKGNPNKYLAKVSQALRIEVNDEMGALKEMLEHSVRLLKPEGRLAIITFHSLEDRMVKNLIRNGTTEELVVDEIYGTKLDSKLSMVNKKPIEATEAEQKRNPRSRSAKLRVAQKKG